MAEVWEVRFFFLNGGESLGLYETQGDARNALHHWVNDHREKHPNGPLEEVEPDVWSDDGGDAMRVYLRSRVVKGGVQPPDVDPRQFTLSEVSE